MKNALITYNLIKIALQLLHNTVKNNQLNYILKQTLRISTYILKQ